MITTNDQHEVKPFSFMHTPGFKSWRTAGLNILKPYYLMSFACKKGRSWITQGMILWCEQDLLNFCIEAQEGSSRKIFQITKLVPPMRGEDEIWTSIPVKEIWQNVVDDLDDLLIVENNRSDAHSRYLSLLHSQKMRKIFTSS